ncbi:MAG: UDP-N-acetylglucosamine--N-acetylmuramyl-(pentapeptide) pyrophosphoryl-undecaprenol N-acetylglucosamine transferase [Dehalococcoidia bacterium]|nr:UDP-N-acetylglucosamine--N-acetylmuramyl-(pentapeptide) pyrophosphoryl-undecaprenol N-acetylglucosamine transferase [Dehalococcoidia bacterium]
MRVVVTGGGTGGHVYPALAVLAVLPEVMRNSVQADVLYIGSKKGMERDIVIRAGFRFAGIGAGPLRGTSIAATLANIARLGIGLAESSRLIKAHGTGVILATGGYVCVPVVVAGWLRGVPSLVYLPDVRPGWAIRFVSRFARAIAVTSHKSKAFLPASKVVETGYPVRPEIGKAEKVAARERLGLVGELPVVLALGGSRGAHTINMAIEKGLQEMLTFCQVLHVCGQEDELRLRQIRETMPDQFRSRYHLSPYIHEEFPDALAAADLAISRSGASVMGEYPAVGLPAILVPYPYAGGHQRLNAMVLADGGAAVLLENDRLSELVSVVSGLLSDKPRLSAMATRARQMSRPAAAEEIAKVMIEIGAPAGAAALLWKDSQ